MYMYIVEYTHVHVHVHCMTLVACQMGCWTKESNILPRLNVVTSNHTPFGLTQPPDAI